jgi:hypothetical protein
MATNCFPADGPTGIGTANPNIDGALLQVQLNSQQAVASVGGMSLNIVDNIRVPPLTLYPNFDAVSNRYTWYLTRNKQNDQGISIDHAGNVGVAPNLSVAGNLSVGGALKIKTWELSVPDYVFRGDYTLPPLSSVAEHVRAHGHLPEVPSAAEIGDGGLDAGRMILLLLKKIEELTLHAIAHEERLAALDARLAALEASAG